MYLLIVAVSACKRSSKPRFHEYQYPSDTITVTVTVTVTDTDRSPAELQVRAGTLSN